MFAEKFSPLISSFPQDADALRRLATYFEGVEARYGSGVFKVKLNPQRLFDISQAGSMTRLAKIVKILIDGHVLERRVVVRSPAGGGIEFRSYAELPDRVRDPLRDVEIEVTEENIEPIYVVAMDE